MSWFSKTKNPQANEKGQVAMSSEFQKDPRFSANFILRAIDDGVAIVDSQGSIHLFNPAASRISGWAADEAVGLNFNNVLPLANERDEPPQAGDSQNHPITQSLARQLTIRDSKCSLVTKSNKRVPLSMSVSPILDEQAKPTGNAIAVFRDMTKERAEEAQRSDFISTASHEMRTPLAAIDGYIALALNDKIAKIDENARKYLQKAATSTKQLGVLFQDLLTSSKVEDGRLASYPAVVELGEIVEQVAENERFHAKEKNLELRYAVSTDKDVAGAKVVRPFFYTFVDPHRVREVLQNIIDNAIKYTPEGGVTVRLTGNPSVVQIQVQDTGPGIPSEDIPHLFQKFYRVDNSLTRSVGGSGLGLFISRKIIEMYNGQLWVDSQLGKGSTFFINLPRLTSDQALQMQKNQAATISPLDERQ